MLHSLRAPPAPLCTSEPLGCRHRHAGAATGSGPGSWVLQRTGERGVVTDSFSGPVPTASCMLQSWDSSACRGASRHCTSLRLWLISWRSLVWHEPGLGWLLQMTAPVLLSSRVRSPMSSRQYCRALPAFVLTTRVITEPLVVPLAAAGGRQDVWVLHCVVLVASVMTRLPEGEMESLWGQQRQAELAVGSAQAGADELGAGGAVSKAGTKC